MLPLTTAHACLCFVPGSQVFGVAVAYSSCQFLVVKVRVPGVPLILILVKGSRSTIWQTACGFILGAGQLGVFISWWSRLASSRFLELARMRFDTSIAAQHGHFWLSNTQRTPTSACVRKR